MPRFWLMKCEPSAYTIDDLARDGRTCWEGVRNYQARNFMRDDMRVGDGVLFYASNADPAGVTGVARICREGHPDHYAWEPGHHYFDARSTAEKPVWYMVDIEYVRAVPGDGGAGGAEGDSRAGADDGGPEGEPAVGPAGYCGGIRHRRTARKGGTPAGRSIAASRRSARRGPQCPSPLRRERRPRRVPVSPAGRSHRSAPASSRRRPRVSPFHRGSAVGPRPLPQASRRER